jgi:hypothetical protein
MEIKRLLKYFAKHGYPSPETLNIMEYTGYDREEFLHDLVEELGYNGAMEFVSRTLGKLSSTSEICIKVNLDEAVSPGSWINLEIYNFDIDLNSEYSDILISYGWGDNVIIHPEDESVTTLEDIADGVDMGDYNEYDEFVDSIRDACYQHIAKNCGFGIWYD